VHVAADAELGRTVALKRVRADRRAEGSVHRFLREAEITARLEHPGIVPVYGLVPDEDGQPCYAMRFVEGETLKDAIDRFHRGDLASPSERRLTFRQLLDHFRNACNAVAYAHSRGVLHRDLKPANILLGKFGETLVVDWGLAKVVGRTEATRSPGESTLATQTSALGDATRHGQAIGTPQYMSPEQAAGMWNVVGPPSDIYSLGATLYYLLTGRPPVRDPDVNVMLFRAQQGEFLPPRQVQADASRALEAVCLKAMARKPEARYATATALAEDVEHWLADEPVGVYRESWPTQLGRWARRHRGWAAGFVAALLVGLAGLAAAALLLGAKNRELEAANQQEQQARAEAQAAGERAEERFTLARDAVDKYLNGVTEDPDLRDKHDLSALRKKLLETAVPFYEALAKQRAGDTDQEVARGLAYDRLAYLREQLGETAAAQADYEEARAVFARLADQFPARPEVRPNLATIYDHLGVLLRSTGRLKEAEEALREALRMRQQLAADFPAEPYHRYALAGSHLNLGAVYSDTGRLRDAEVAYHEAIRIWQQLAAESPGDAGHRELLAQGYVNLCNVLFSTGRLKEAEAAVRESLRLSQQLADSLPDRPELRWVLARGLESLGTLLGSTGRPKEAEAAYQDAIRLLERLARDFPTRPDFREALADSHSRLGGLLLAACRRKEAEAALREAIRLQERLAGDFPARPRIRLELAYSYSRLGDLCYSTPGRQPEAEATFRDAVRLWQRVLADSPGVPLYEHGLAGVLVNLAMALRDRRDFAAARQRLDEAVPHHQAALKANPRGDQYRLFYRNNLVAQMSVLVGLGDPAAALRTEEQLRSLGWDPAADYFAVAGGLAQCVAVVEKDPALSPEQRRQQGTSYADRAMALLREAVAKGLKNPDLLKDEDFDPIRKRDDFQKLLADLEAKK
jgi:serine/threonine-protein kinase